MKRPRRRLSSIRRDIFLFGRREEIRSRYFKITTPLAGLRQDARAWPLLERETHFPLPQNTRMLSTLLFSEVIIRTALFRSSLNDKRMYYYEF